jgi:hypothetical protein
MEGRDSFLDQLEQALAAHREDLEKNALPRLQELFRLHHTYFENLYNILLRKALVQEDPYKYDERIVEVEAPSRDGFLESERQEQMSQRLSVFHSQLEFLNSTYQPSVEYLTMDRIRRFGDLVRYIQWHNLAANNSDLVTRSLADLINRIKGGSDPVSTQIVLDSRDQLAEGVKEILATLGKVVVHQREAYKARVRREVMPSLDGQGAADDATLARVKQVFAREASGEKFYAELVQEVLAEDFSAEGAALRQQALKRLAVQAKKNKKKSKADLKPLLLQAIRALASAGMQLQDCVTKVKENNTLYLSRRRSLGELLRRFFKKIAGGHDNPQVYEIESSDGTASTPKREKISIEPFLEELEKRARLLSALTVSNSTASTRLRQASEEKIFEFLTRHLSAVQTEHRQLTGLNEFFRSEMPRDRKGGVRGLRVELSAIKNAIIKSNQQRHEYVAAREEETQIEKLLKKDRAGSQ